MSQTLRAHVDLPVDGMTCAACASRVERAPERHRGRRGVGQLALERAAVDYDPAPGLAGRSRRGGRGGRLRRAPPGRDAAAAPTTGSACASSSRRCWRSRHRLRDGVGLQSSGRDWVALALTLPAVVWGGWPIHRATVRGLRHRAVDDGHADHARRRRGARLVGRRARRARRRRAPLPRGRGRGDAFLLVGRYLEARAKRQRRRGAARPARARRARTSPCSRDGVERRVPLSAARASATGSSCGRASRSPPTASSSEGLSAVDRSLLTGESVPVEVAPGDAVIGATVNAGGRLVVAATRVGADTALARIARLVEEAQSGKAPVQRLADRVVGRVRAGRDRARRSPRSPAGCSPARRRRRLRRRRRRADHRLPVRARAWRRRRRCWSAPAAARSSAS